MTLDKVYIVARSRREANEYAAEKGLSRSETTVIAEAGQVRGARRGEIHLLPGWDRHPKRHALRAALRYARVPIVEVEAGEAPQKPDVPLDPGLEALISNHVTGLEVLDNRGALTERQLEVAYRYNRLLDEVPAVDEDYFDGEAFVDPGRVADELATIGVESEHGEEAGEAQPSEDPAPTEEQVSRRRSRCKQCDQLHYKGDPCPTTED